MEQLLLGVVINMNNIIINHNIVAIAAGANHSIALKENGTVVTWGDNKKEQYNNQPKKNKNNYFKST